KSEGTLIKGAVGRHRYPRVAGALIVATIEAVSASTAREMCIVALPRQTGIAGNSCHQSVCTPAVPAILLPYANQVCGIVGIDDQPGFNLSILVIDILCRSGITLINPQEMGWVPLHGSSHENRFSWR